ncbi:MAG: hypothetical protein A4S09_11150 [Proteobacteria bacterium SG_bin7]|nr:MAG: hypothetical protein A4S09_11150 [Proteobacteria bacterium SG_bin7]
MGMLDRYRKKGGFRQLLQLIETCATAKQTQFMEIVKKEDPTWAKKISKKMLSMELVFSWPIEVVGEFATEIPLRTLAIALKKVGPAGLEKATATLPHLKKREVEEMFSTLNPNPNEVHAASIKVIEKVRQLIDNGKIRLDRFAPDLALTEEEAA